MHFCWSVLCLVLICFCWYCIFWLFLGSYCTDCLLAVAKYDKSCFYLAILFLIMMLMHLPALSELSTNNDSSFSFQFFRPFNDSHFSNSAMIVITLDANNACLLLVWSASQHKTMKQILKSDYGIKLDNTDAFYQCAGLKYFNSVLTLLWWSILNN